MQFLVAPSRVGTAKPYVLAILRFAVYCLQQEMWFLET
jgi:hypothetical protein